MDIIDLIGYIPAVIFPTATLLQLVHLLKEKNAEGVSLGAWSAFAVGNFSLYVYTEKYSDIQTILGLLGTGVLQLVIIALIMKYKKRRPK